MEDAYHWNLKERTGRPFEEWVALAKREGPKDRNDLLKWLKKQHGLSSNYAWWVAKGERSSAANYDPETMVEAMYSGKKAALRPIYERLLDAGLGLGKDVKACPCQTIVPLYRNHVFAQIKPTTRTRIDLGFALGKTKAPKRLIPTGGAEKGDRITHRIPIEKAADIDDEVKQWLLKAYELDA
jgi:hypothetical protein